VADKAETGDSPADFLAQLSTALLAHEGVDSELAEILKTHILAIAPATDCVTKAKAAISALAKKRAAPPEPAENGAADG
jgi:hypothetical protein